jgi:hypothetical protein
MTVKTFVSAISLSSALLASSAMAEQGDVTEFLSTNEQSATAQFFEAETGGQLFISIHRDGVDISCSDSWDGHLDVVKIVSDGKRGRATVDPLGEVDCLPGEDPVDGLTLECEFDDVFWLHSDGFSTTIILGERSKSRSQSWFASANCTVSVNGESLEAGGLISGGIER